jgi:hypothetical protein
MKKHSGSRQGSASAHAQNGIGLAWLVLSQVVSRWQFVAQAEGQRACLFTRGTVCVSAKWCAVKGVDLQWVKFPPGNGRSSR